MPPRLRFRAYRESDREILRAMTIEAFEGVSIDHAIDRTLGPIAERDWRFRKGKHVDDDIDTPGGEILVVEEEGEPEPLGYVSLRMDAVAKVGWIPNLAVSKSRRNQGIGRILLDRAIERFREAGMKVAKIETLEHNQVGRYLYPSVGFVEVTRQVHFAMDLTARNPREPGEIHS